MIGRVAFIDPTVDPQTRSIGVRVELQNEHRQLRPGDYAAASITLPIGLQGQVYDADLAGKWISPMHPQIVREESGQCPICGMDLVPTSKYGFTDAPLPQRKSGMRRALAVLLAGGNSVVYVEVQPENLRFAQSPLVRSCRTRLSFSKGLRPGNPGVATAGNFLNRLTDGRQTQPD